MYYNKSNLIVVGAVSDNLSTNICAMKLLNGRGCETMYRAIPNLQNY